MRRGRGRIFLLLYIVGMDRAWFWKHLIFSSLASFSGRRKWQPTPVFLPGESCGQRSLEGCCPQGRTESDTTEVTQYACMHWRRKWQPPPVFLPGESQGRGSLVGCCLWGRTESDTTEVTQQQQQHTVLYLFYTISISVPFCIYFYFYTSHRFTKLDSQNFGTGKNQGIISRTVFHEKLLLLSYIKIGFSIQRLGKYLVK